MIDRWKLKRELAVLKGQLFFPVTVVLDAFRKRRYDREKGRLVRLTDGAIALRDDVAVVLIYQPAGVPASLFGMLRHLAAKGFAPMVVSNLPLTDTDRGRLAEASWRVMERPNYGYDFGGYRDGVLHLLDSGIVPRNLLLANDSIWFPVFGDSDLLDRLRATEADVSSPIVARYKHHPDRIFLHSYLMNFGRTATASPGFRAYWQDLPLSNDKMTVVRRGEKKLAIRMQAIGLSVGHVWSFDDVARVLRGLPPDRLTEIAGYYAATYPGKAAAIRAAAAGPGGIPAVLESLIAAQAFGRDLLRAHPALTLGALGVPFVKKLREAPFKAMRQALMSSDLADRLDPAVRDEMTGWDR